MFSLESFMSICRGALNLTERSVPFFRSSNPFLSNARENPLITTGITIGLVCLMINAVPFLPGANALVVPCGKVITQLFFNALNILRVSEGSSPRRISLPPSFHVLFTVSAPANVKNLARRLLCIVSSAATYFIFVKGQRR